MSLERGELDNDNFRPVGMNDKGIILGDAWVGDITASITYNVFTGEVTDLSSAIVSAEHEIKLHNVFGINNSGAMVAHADIDDITMDVVLYPMTNMDFDLDADVDLMDFTHFQECFNGPDRLPAQVNCQDADVDGDNDVDLIDFNRFQYCFNGPYCSTALGCY